MKKRNSIRNVCICAVIAAIYVILTSVSASLGIASGVIQVRISESLCILPMFTSASIPGLTIGCLISNLITGAVLPDVVFGTFATFIGAIGTYFFRKNKFVAFIMPILSNTLIIPFVLKFAYQIKDAYWFLVLTIFIGECISIGVLGILLYKAFLKRKYIF